MSDSIQKTVGRFHIDTSGCGSNWITIRDRDNQITFHGLKPEDAKDLIYGLKRTLKGLKAANKKWKEQNS